LKERNLQPEDLGAFFAKVDLDGSDEITLDEFYETFIKMKLTMRGVDRAVAYFRKAFAQADTDGSGALGMNEFRALCNNPRTVKRLNALGVAIGEIEVLFEKLDGCGGGETKEGKITADEMIAGFLSVREKGLGESRGVNFLRQLFREADVNGNGSLTKQEIKRTFCTEKVSQKLHKLQLKEPDWMDIFDALDLDSNGTLSWNELSQGVCQLWKHAIEEDVRNRAITSATSRKSATRVSLIEASRELTKEDDAKLEVIEDAVCESEKIGAEGANFLSPSTSASTMAPSSSAASLPEACTPHSVVPPPP